MSRPSSRAEFEQDRPGREKSPAGRLSGRGPSHERRPLELPVRHAPTPQGLIDRAVERNVAALFPQSPTKKKKRSSQTASGAGPPSSASTTAGPASSSSKAPPSKASSKKPKQVEVIKISAADIMSMIVEKKNYLEQSHHGPCETSEQVIDRAKAYHKAIKEVWPGTDGEIPDFINSLTGGASKLLRNERIHINNNPSLLPKTDERMLKRYEEVGTQLITTCESILLSAQERVGELQKVGASAERTRSNLNLHMKQDIIPAERRNPLIVVHAKKDNNYEYVRVHIEHVHIRAV